MVNSGIRTGCGSCAALCPHGYISLVSGNLGFYVPNMEKCEGCGKCLKGCPFYEGYEDED